MMRSPSDGLTTMNDAAYDMGVRDFTQGKLHTENPFKPIARSKHQWWSIGWLVAEYELQRSGLDADRIIAQVRQKLDERKLTQ